eukprot:2772417-Prymnesium_polylepis.1
MYEHGQVLRVQHVAFTSAAGQRTTGRRAQDSGRAHATSGAGQNSDAVSGSTPSGGLGGADEGSWVESGGVRSVYGGIDSATTFAGEGLGGGNRMPSGMTLHDSFGRGMMPEQGGVGTGGSAVGDSGTGGAPGGVGATMIATGGNFGVNGSDVYGYGGDGMGRGGNISGITMEGCGNLGGGMGNGVASSSAKGGVVMGGGGVDGGIVGLENVPLKVEEMVKNTIKVRVLPPGLLLSTESFRLCFG